MNEAYPLSGPPHNGRIRTTAMVGMGAAMLFALIHSGSVTENDFGFTIWIILAWASALGLIFRSGRRLLLAHPELLVPIGYVLPLHVLIGWLASTPRLQGVMQPIATLSFWSSGFTLSIPDALFVTIWTAYAAWQTDLLIRALSTTAIHEVDLSPGEPIRRLFWRTFGALFVGVAGIQIVLAPIMRGYESTAFEPASFPWFAFFIITVTVLWNIATFLLVPWVLLSRDPFWTAAKDGLRLGVRRYFKSILPVAAHLALVGILTYFRFHAGYNFSYSSNVHNAWIGGYQSHTSWYSDHQSWLKMPVSPFVSTLLAGLFLILAAAIKAPVIQSLLVKPGALPAELDSGPVVEPEPVPAAKPELAQTGPWNRPAGELPY